VLAETHHSLPALNTTARSEVGAVEPGLSLLALVNRRGTSDLSDLHARLAALSRDTQPDDAAVLMLDLRDRIAQSKKDVSTLLPAKMIVVSTESQNATMYEGGSQVYSTPVTTGGPELPTDHGVFHIYMKASNFTFHSPWPEGSPYYYPPTFVQYWMPFYGGEGLHDASWRTNFGPGSNLSPTDLGTGNYILGTHGCVNLPTAAAAFVWNWAPIGTTVVVI
jgi:lipoprotein-anchoring transpeptidase ErfK/SrfK